jgi:pimeloyl-ACP methyl ester carboxylesterase
MLLERSMTTLVLLPGMDGTGELFQPFIAALSAHVKSIVVPYPTSVPLDYEDLIGLARDKLPVEDEFFILGESFSGPLAISLAVHAPPNLRGLILCASFAQCPLPWSATWKPLSYLVPFGRIPTSILSLPLLGRFGSPEARRLLASALSKVHANVLRARLRAVLTVDVREEAAAVKVPFLYLQSSADWVVPKSASASIRQIAQGLQVVELDGPHMLLQVSPTAAARAVETFIDVALLREPPHRREIDGQEQA